MSNNLPKIGLTMGDPSGIGPEVTLRAMIRLRAEPICDAVLIGDAKALQAAADFANLDLNFTETGDPECVDLKSSNWSCWNPSKKNDLSNLELGFPQAAAGQAAFDCLNGAIDLALDGKIDGITTAPLHKEALNFAGIKHPGHTEILAERCGTDDFAMMLYLPADENRTNGFCIAHVTLHTSIKSVPGLLSTEKIEEKIRLVDHFLKNIGISEPRIGVCSLNPHGGEHGLFGNEESTIIEPAVFATETENRNVSGPFPADTLLKRAIVDSEFDGIVAMYHEQGHIAIKLIAFNTAVNVTLGLPIIRTSPSHGTAFDKVGKIPADESGMWEALKVAANLAQKLPSPASN